LSSSQRTTSTEARIESERFYGWEVERLLTVVRAVLALAASTFGLVLAAVLEDGTRFGLWQIFVAATALGASLSAVVFLYAKLGRLFGKYLESLDLFAVVQRSETDRWIP
jgi:glucose uptake protein GlcU